MEAAVFYGYLSLRVVSLKLLQVSQENFNEVMNFNENFIFKFLLIKKVACSQRNGIVISLWIDLDLLCY